MDVMAKRIKEFFFIILLFTFSLGEIARIQLSNGIAIKALDVAVLFVALLVLHSRKKLARPRLAKPILIFSSIAAFSLLINFSNLKTNEFTISLLYLVRWIVYAGVYFAVLNLDTNFKKKIPNFLLTAGGVILFLGYAQYFLYSDLRNLYYLGWDEHLYRLFSSFLDPNFAGAFLALYFLFVFGLFVKSRSLVYGFISALSLIAIALTFSRSAYLMLFAGVFTFLFLHGRKKLILGFIVLFVVAALTLSVVGFRSEGTNLLRITSTQARLPSAAKALAIFESNPILGVGFNAYEFANNRHGLSKESKYPNHSAAGTDNSFLFVMATTGIVGLISYLYLWFKILSVFRQSPYSTILISSSVALFVGSIFVNSLFYTFIMLWMWILVGIAED